MKATRTISLAALTLAAMLGLPPIGSGGLGIAAAQAAGGCGPGFHRGPYGACRLNVSGAPGYYGPRGGGVYGYRGGARYGYRGGAVYRGARVYRGGRVYGGRAVYGRRVGGFRGGFRR
ncbi:hypothetical protein MCBMB27_04261 [Methylobacterium phyllosphaerae]|uniref:ATP-dependent RNA helicase A n=1 Tax=Methylobacterium phyllosphaerae TaxID=418223 RepID=A0AAE8HXS8_9HYPH|nr:hypothetical protein [Methylobacterium phyllosphaerae]APT33552.1 hypothetical protein MCBMB27_04261 [Methylobacterium phyllosphaerae]SFH66484.1 ATP-dependent RNA helicase A [Methylobacterium phyllosphaerae]